MRNWIVFFGMSLFTMASAFAGEGHVGEIRYSILELKQFQTLYGPEWELMKGQDVPADSELRHLWGQSNLPDARGVFLRCANHGRDKGTGNPEGDIKVGEHQGDQVIKHSHGAGAGCYFFESVPKAVSHHKSGFPPGPAFDDGNGISRIADTAVAGGSETRPRNITVNAYIKIRESAPKAPKNPVTPELKSEIVNSPEFKEAVSDAVRSVLRSGR